MQCRWKGHDREGCTGDFKFILQVQDCISNPEKDVEPWPISGRNDCLLNILQNKTNEYFMLPAGLLLRYLIWKLEPGLYTNFL